MATPAGTQGVVLPRRDAVKIATPAKKVAKEGLIRELYKRSPKPVWTPSFSVAFRMLLLVRVCAAMYTSNTADCDEVYNYWEPLHFLLHGDGFRTWEYSSKYAIRSWAYLLLHAGPAKILTHVNPNDKRISFFSVRLAFGIASSLVESRFYRSIVDHVNPRVGRYTLLFLLTSAGMYNAATTFLPSTFSMYFVTLAWSYAMEPVNSSSLRTQRATLCFAVAAIVGWPFSILLAAPFVHEELFLRGHASSSSIGSRLARLVTAALPAVLLLAGVTAIDSYFYGRLVFVPFNIISYNVLSKTGGPDLYGTDPWYFYVFNGLLNFNLALPLALLALPFLLITSTFLPKKLLPAQPGQTSNTTLLTMRLMPFYLWYGILSLQAHKEERFLFPAFPLICFQAATSLALMRGWMEQAYVKITKAPFEAARTPIFSFATSYVIAVSVFISFARILAISAYYRAPMPLLFHLQYTELPSLAIQTYPALYPKLNLTNFAEAEEQIDISILRDQNLTLCYGKEWYRFPSSFLVPNEVRVEFVKSDFEGILPKHFVEKRDEVQTSKSSIARRLEIASQSPPGFNDQNREETDRYVPVESCSYLIDLDFPRRYTGDSVAISAHEPRYAVDSDNWERVVCKPFLDASQTSLARRALRFAFSPDPNPYGDYCLLRNTKLKRNSEL